MVDDTATVLPRRIRLLLAAMIATIAGVITVAVTGALRAGIVDVTAVAVAAVVIATPVAGYWVNVAARELRQRRN